MSNWRDLVTASLIGTERAAVPPAAIPGLPPLSDAAGDDPAAVLLDRAALAAVARRAGRRPGHAEPLPADEPDPRPAVSPAAGRRLARLLSGEHQDLLAEWLAAASVRGLRPPWQLLPALLDRARHPSAAGPGASALRYLVAEAGGSRARWLAGLNREWEFVRDRRAARELIADGWAAAGPDERVMFVSVLAGGVSLDDEPLLEAALDDGTAWVRTMAADVLAALPGSALARRMAERAAGCLRLEDGTGGPRLVIVPPAGADAAMRRDGITPGPAAGRSPMAGRAALVPEIVARTPLRTWTREFGLTPAQIAAVPAGDWAPALHAGWLRAALAQGDQEWVTAVIGRVLTGLPSVTAAEIAALPQRIRRADPALGAPGALPSLAAEAPTALRDAIGVLRFRYEMLKELDHDHGDG